MSFEDILKKLDNKSHYVVIDRKQFDCKEKHFEVGFCEMNGSQDHFLFIEVKDEEMFKIIEKYNLTVRKC